MQAPATDIHMGNAGTPIRLLISTAGLAHGRTVLTGNERMQERPMGHLLEALALLGVPTTALRGNGSPHIAVEGSTFVGGPTAIHGTRRRSRQLQDRPPRHRSRTAVGVRQLLVGRQVDSGELRDGPLLREACATLAATGGALHLVGLCSDGRIHSDIAHFGELLRAPANAGVRTVWIHAITDGRDVADGTAAHHLVRLTVIAAEAGAGAVATVVGRNYAMDKSGKAELTAKACALLRCQRRPSWRASWRPLLRPVERCIHEELDTARSSESLGLHLRGGRRAPE